MKKTLISIKDIAQATGYSPTTVSFVVNGRADSMRISLKAQNLIMETAREMGYAFPEHVKTPKRVPTRTRIAVFWSDFHGASSLCSFFCAMEENVARRNNFDYVVVPYQSGKLVEKEYLIARPYYDGVIVTGIQDDELSHLEASHFDIPIVVFNRYSSFFNCVNTDDYEVGRMAFNALYGQNRHYGIVLPDTPLNSIMRINSLRKIGFQDAAAVQKVPDTNISLQSGDNTIQGGKAAFERLIRRSPSISCVFCTSGPMAAGILQYAQQHHIKIPDDVELIAGNDLFSHETLTPSITSFCVPYTEMVSNCLDLLLQEISSGTSLAVCKTSSMSCIYRDSCKKPTAPTKSR